MKYPLVANVKIRALAPELKLAPCNTTREFTFTEADKVAVEPT